MTKSKSRSTAKSPSRPRLTPSTQSTTRNSRTTVSGPTIRRPLHAGDPVLNSQTDVEKKHIINAFRFELSRVQTPAVRERMVSGLMNVAAELATAVATGLGIRDMPAPMPKVLTRKITPEVSSSPALSLLARPGDGRIVTRRIAILVADGCHGPSLIGLANRLTADGAVPRFVAATLGSVRPSSGEAIEVDVSFEAAPSVLYDAMVLPDGSDVVRQLRADGRTLEFLKDQYRHCKPILAWGARAQLLDACGIATDKPEPGLIVAAVDSTDAPDRFVKAIASIGISSARPTHRASDCRRRRSIMLSNATCET